MLLNIDCGLTLIYVLSKNKKYIIFLSENYNFYSHEKLQYIALACLRIDTGKAAIENTKMNALDKRESKLS